jgi:C4-type Zn-finger protein
MEDLVLGEAPDLNRYGIEDPPECPLCGERMFLSRRIPHQGFGEEYELQTFTCSRCDVRIQRTIDEFGSLYR